MSKRILYKSRLLFKLVGESSQWFENSKISIGIPFYKNAKDVLNDFIQLAEKLLHLKALKLDVFDDTEETWTDMLFEVIVCKCPRLKHFGLSLFYASKVSSEKLALLAGLPNLCSIQLHSYSSAGPIPISTLFQKLPLSGQLQYFNTNGVLVLEDVCQALVRCENLTRIFCGQSEVEEDQQRECFDLLLSTLEIIHEGQQLPATPNDGRILHTNFGNHNKKNFPHHPWVRFYENHGRFPPSKVREEVYLAGVSSKPNSCSFDQLRMSEFFSKLFFVLCYLFVIFER
uniref:Uncharacterized protein n=1 Tax=Ditylenchus dipsaci TaxID=166011 RepID=A0A915CUD9_9BILA